MGLGWDLSKIIGCHHVVPFAASGTSTLTSTEVDLSPKFDSLMALVVFGTAAANNTMAIHGTKTTGGSFAQLGEAVASGAQRMCVNEIKLSQYRHVRLELNRGTATTVEFGLIIPYFSKSGSVDPTTEWNPLASYLLQVSPIAAA